MRKIHDVQQAKDHGEAQTQHGVERAVDQPEQQLAEERLMRNAEYFHECLVVESSLQPTPAGCFSQCRYYFFSNEHFDSATVVNA